METNTNAAEAKQPASAGCHPTTCCLSSDTPETDDQVESAHNMCLYYDCQGKDDDIEYPIVVPANFARKLERERNAALDALDKIESHYVDGDDTYEAWKAMGEIAATFLAENVKHIHGGAGLPKQPETPTPLDGASC